MAQNFILSFVFQFNTILPKRVFQARILPLLSFCLGLATHQLLATLLSNSIGEKLFEIFVEIEGEMAVQNRRADRKDISLEVMLNR